MTELTSEKLQEYITGWRKRAELDKKQMATRARNALSTARFLAGLLAAEPGVTRVWLFGSLVLYWRGWRKFRVDSDIDLAIEGLPPERFFPVLSLLNEKSSRPVDLVEITTCTPSLRKSILERGLLLYERPGANPNPGG